MCGSIYIATRVLWVLYFSAIRGYKSIVRSEIGFRFYKEFWDSDWKIM